MLWNPEVHFCIYKSSLPVRILSQINPVHALTSHFLKIHLILSSLYGLGLPTGFFPSVFPTKTLCAPLLAPICNTPCPSHSYQLITQITFGEEYRSLSSSLCSLLHLPVTFVPLRPKYPQNPILKHPQPIFLPEHE